MTRVTVLDHELGALSEGLTMQTWQDALHITGLDEEGKGFRLTLYADALLRLRDYIALVLQETEE